MIITWNILSYCMSEVARMPGLETVPGADGGFAVRHVREKAAGKEISAENSGILYVDKEGDKFVFESDIPGPGGRGTAVLGTCEADRSMTAMITGIMECIDQLREWDAHLAGVALGRSSLTEALDEGQRFFPQPCAMMDTNMEILYASPRYRRFMGKWIEEGRFSQEAISELVMDRTFHEAALLREVFYYHTPNGEYGSLCGNIIVKDHYYARMVVQLDKGVKKFHPGEEELLAFMCAGIQAILTASPGQIHRRQEDMEHEMFAQLAAGKRPSPYLVSSVMGSKGIREEDELCVIQIAFYSRDDWLAQAETTIPYLAWTLETEWPFSCAIPWDNGLLWGVNLSRSNADLESGDFFRQLSFFLREHVCSAGVSSTYRSLYNTIYAIRQAAAALEIGRDQDPQFWSFRFRDYRREYMSRRITEEIPAELLLPGSLQIIRAWDAAKNTELEKTLKTFVLCGQNDSHTAGELHVHRTTLYRRMEKIRELTNIDTADPDTVLDLLLAWKIA